MSGSLISLFSNIKASIPFEEISFQDFYFKIKTGFWSEIANQINVFQDKEARQIAKKKVPYVTVSGTFSERKKDGLTAHSGLIAIDIDNLSEESINKTFDKLIRDKHCYCCFKSISGKGLCFVVKIDPDKHLDSFKAIELYFSQQYDIAIDKSCKDVSRARFVSFDENAFLNEKSEIWNNFLTKQKKQNIPKSLNHIVVGENDISRILDTIRNSRIDLTDDDYDKRLNIGFALANGYGEIGRSYFHEVCQNCARYNYEECDRQYSHCLRGTDGSVSLSTFFFYVKDAGIELVSQKTKEVTSITRMQKKSGLTEAEIKKALQELKVIEDESFNDVIKDAYNNDNISSDNGLNGIELIEYYLRLNHDFRKNEISRKIEIDGVDMDETVLNSIYVSMKKNVSDKVNYQDLERVIKSDFVPVYNPFKVFIEQNSFKGFGHIDKLISSVKTKKGAEENINYFFKKWYVSIVRAALGEHSPLVFIATGAPGNGKTEFFRRLLPRGLKSYYAESKLDAGKDDEILMCQKLLVLDDEYAGKSKKDEKRIKELTSKDTFSLREPFGRMNVDLKRLAVLCGTSNEDEILSDMTGNRRIIPFNVLSIDHDVYNSVDKTDCFMEAVELLKEGFSCDIMKDDIIRLNNYTASIRADVITREEEFFVSCFAFEDDEINKLTTGMNRQTEFTGLELSSLLEIEYKVRSHPKTISLILRKLGVKMKIIRGLKYWSMVKLDAHEKNNRDLIGVPF